MLKIAKYIKNPLLQKIVVYAFSDGISKALPFLLFPLIAYYLTKEEFGLVTNYNVLISVIGPFIGMSATSYLAVEYYNKDSNPKSVYLNLLYLNLLLFILVALLIFIFHKYVEQYSGLSLKWITLAIAGAIFAAIMDLFFTKIRMDENARLFGIVNVLNSALGAFLTVLFVIMLKWGWEGRIYSLFIASGIAGLISLYFSIKYIGQFKKPNVAMFKNILTFGIPLLPHQLAVWIKTGFEKFFITASLGLGQNGVYSFAITICAIFVMVSNAFFSAFSPYVYKTLSEIKEGSNEYAIKLNIVKKSYAFLLVYLAVLIIGGLASTIFINFYFKAKYGESIIYLPFLLGFNFFNSCYIVLSMFVFYSKTTKYLSLITLSTSMLQVVLMMLLVNRMGALGAALSAFLVSILTMIIVYFYSNKVYKMPWFNYTDLLRTKPISS